MGVLHVRTDNAPRLFPRKMSQRPGAHLTVLRLGLMEMRPETTNHASSGASKAHGVTFWVHLDFETMSRQRTTALRWDIGGHLRN